MRLREPRCGAASQQLHSQMDTFRDGMCPTMIPIPDRLTSRSGTLPAGVWVGGAKFIWQPIMVVSWFLLTYHTRP
jgi:hypothetical protein